MARPTWLFESGTKPGLSPQLNGNWTSLSSGVQRLSKLVRDTMVASQEEINLIEVIDSALIHLGMHCGACTTMEPVAELILKLLESKGA